ncbi:MAG: flagellar basal-body MS-ring/collar protein FliF [Spirochaetia bacterium]|nr:flagellar basal-body MS-ring/collar protein FliF [Spirochaetia bacterium]
MPDFNKIIENIKAVFEKLDATQKIIAGAVAATAIASLVMIGSYSSTGSKVSLFQKKLEAKEFADISGKLEEMGFGFTTSGIEVILVSPEQKGEIMMKLAQEGLIPAGVAGWELFDMDKWSETQFEKEIKTQRALMGALTRTLSTLKSVDSAVVNIAFPKEQLFEERVEPRTASVILKYAPGIENLSRREIEGIVTLVSRSVPGLKKENVSIAGPDGEILNDFDNELDKEKAKIKRVEDKLRIQERERIKLLTDINNSLVSFFGKDRADVVRLDLEMRWDEEESEETNVAPVIMKKDNPDTPYSEEVVQDSLAVSTKEVEEKFEGNGFTPEGPAGSEPNLPPGYKDKDYQKAKYTKIERIENNKFNENVRRIKKQPWEFGGRNLAVIIDGKWERVKEKEDETGYERKYHTVTAEELRNITDVLKKAIDYSASRGDQISVQHIQKDRFREHEEEDAELRKSKAMRKMLLVGLISLMVVFLAFAVYHVIKREMEKRRRLREEELAAQQQMMREAALRAIEEEGVEVELSLEEKARKEMLENAVSLAKERPEDVAQLLRTWLAADE